MTWRVLHAQGNVEPLSVDAGKHSCGDIRDGVAMRFGRHGGWVGGGWVVELEDLTRLVAEAHAARGNAQQAYELNEKLLELQAVRVLRLKKEAEGG